jgi:N6-L-threonylcarbamoyladenine synthase/protein kinase Bud32
MAQKILARGAEANIILVKQNGKEPFIIKDRIKKSYRFPQIDEQIRGRRTRAEAKLLTKASQIINSPLPFFEPSIKNSSKLKMPFVKGKKLSDFLDKFPLNKQKEICKIIGNNIAKLHDNDIIHGDLTTSNMILVEDKNETGKKLVNKKGSSNVKLKVSSGAVGLYGFKIYFIDFGLGFISPKVEDKAVDLHVLRQALEAKHFKHWQVLFTQVLKGYSASKNHKKVLEQFKKVEARGRYKEKY